MSFAAIFLGPTLPAREASSIPDCLVLPPAGQGDIYRLVRDHRPAAIGLVDGAFLDVRPVWHREILWALTQGVAVFGAASMGALRAAELDRFGMRGVGRIYEAFRDGRWPETAEPFEDDDEVAVIHAPPEAGGAALSDAMVDIRDTLLAAEQAGVIAAATRLALTAAMKRLHFSRRSLSRICEEAARLADPEAARQLADFCVTGAVARKRLDALAMLAAMKQFLARDAQPPEIPTFVFQRALVWENFVAAAAADEADRLDATEVLVLAELRLDPAAWREARHATAGVSHPHAEYDSDLAAALDRFRRRRGLWQHADLVRWMADNALDQASMARLLRREAALDAAPGSVPGSDGAMIAHLRLSGRFSGLLRRARAKQAATAGASRDAHALRIAVDWYLETRIGVAGSAALGRLVSDHGWADTTQFAHAAWAEHVFAGPGADHGAGP